MEPLRTSTPRGDMIDDGIACDGDHHRRLSRSKRVLPLNLLALPLFALAPPLENVALRELARRRAAASDAVPVERRKMFGRG